MLLWGTMSGRQKISGSPQVVGGGYALWRGDNTTTSGIAVTECFEQVRKWI